MVLEAVPAFFLLIKLFDPFPVGRIVGDRSKLGNLAQRTDQRKVFQFGSAEFFPHRIGDVVAKKNRLHSSMPFIESLLT